MRAIAQRFFRQSQSPAVRELDCIIAEIAPTEIPVMIVGESGTGKEFMALDVHRLSARKNEPFQKLTCPSLTAAGFQRWLDGDKGAFGQGVDSAGTVFLDEIAELDPVCQPRLLLALPDGDAVQEPRRLRARVISCTRRNLEDEIRAGRFREDLYYRLNDVCLRLPPLRQRREDIPGFVELFLEKYSMQFARQKPSLSSHTLDKLQNYSWPGNIRQLENAVKKIVALGDEQLALSDLGSSASEPPHPLGTEVRVSLKQASRAASQQAEKELILTVLERTRWNRKRAAKELQISYKALLYKLKLIGLDDSARCANPLRDQE